MKENIIFIYAKDGRIKTLNHEESLNLHDRVIGKGWTHTKTLDIRVFIQHIYNDCNDKRRIELINNLGRNTY